MTEQEISDMSLLYQSVPQLIRHTAGSEHYVHISGEWNENDNVFMNILPQKEFHELLQLGLEAYKEKHGDPEPSTFWEDMTTAFNEALQEGATIEYKIE